MLIKYFKLFSIQITPLVFQLSNYDFLITKKSSWALQICTFDIHI
jgi:hypothetical protein